MNELQSHADWLREYDAEENRQDLGASISDAEFERQSRIAAPRPLTPAELTMTRSSTRNASGKHGESRNPCPTSCCPWSRSMNPCCPMRCAHG